MLKKFKKFWEHIIQVDTPLVSKPYVEKTVHLLYWLGLVIAITGFFGGVVAWIVDGQFLDFVMVFLSGLGIWLALIVVCCFMTLGILKVTALEGGTKPKKPEIKPEEKIEEQKDA